MSIDRYDVRLAASPTGTVYVTVSAARSPQEETAGWSPDRDRRHRLVVRRDHRRRLQRGLRVPARRLRQQLDVVAGAATLGRAHLHRRQLLRRPAGLRARCRRPSIRRRPCRRRQPQRHLRRDARYDGAAVRNVEVTVRDNDTPGVYVLQVQPGTSIEDKRTRRDRGWTRPPDSPTSCWCSSLRAPAMDTIVVVHLLLDADSDAAISISAADPLDTRYDASTPHDHVHPQRHARRLGRPGAAVDHAT